MRVCAENSGLIHIIPETVHIVAALENIIVEKAAPEVLGIGVQEIDPDGVSRPAVTLERLWAVCILTNENVRKVASRLLLVLHFDALRVDEIVIRYLDMRVDNHNDATTLLLNLSVHLLNLSVGEVLRVKLEVFVASGVAVLLSPLNIGPEHIDREFVVSEFAIPVHQHVR